MTIYWEQCDICELHTVTKECTLNGNTSVCPHCCIACPRRALCPRPVWFPTRKPARPTTKAKEARVTNKEKILEELLKKLEHH